MVETCFRIDCRNITYCNYDCENCAKELLKELKSQSGIKQARFEGEYGHNALLTVEYDNTKIDNKKITELINSTPKKFQETFHSIIIEN